MTKLETIQLQEIEQSQGVNYLYLKIRTIDHDIVTIKTN